MKDKSASITIRGEEITIKPLTWKESAHVIRKVSSSIVSVVDGKGGFALNAANVTTAIGAQEELLEFVLAKSTGKDAEWVNSLTPREAIPIVSIVVDLNLDREVIDLAKNLGARVTSVITKQAPVTQ